MVIKKDILYPIFLECIQFCENNFWINLFEDLSYGKCPYGTYIHKNFFSCNYKNKEFSYKIDNVSSKNLYENIFSLLVNKIGILSDEERKSKLLDFFNIDFTLDENKYEKWSLIKKKNVKDSLLDRFLINMKYDFELSDIQIKKLQKIINLGLIFKTISHKDIIMKNGEIESIHGFEFYHGKYDVNKDLIKSEPYEYGGESNSNTQRLVDIWRKEYIEKVDYSSEF
jgi:hypothetical protein